MFLKAPPKTEIFVYWSQYGAINGARTASKARCWLIADGTDPDAALKLIVGTNDPDTGQVVYETLDVTGAHISRFSSATFDTTVGKISQMQAPCVCGAGAIGYAGPTADRHTITMLDPRNHNQIQT